MRKVPVCIISLLFSFSAFSFSAQLQLDIRVLAPDSTPVSGAQLTVYPVGLNTPVAKQSTNGEGAATFNSLPDGDLQIEVLAPGFAKKVVTQKPTSGALNIQLQLPTREETVVVTANETPLAVEDSGSRTSVLDRQTLDLFQPVSLNDALRFMPGAIINSTGRRGSLSSLFVRGGDSRYNKVIIDGVSVNDPGGTFDFGVVPTQETDRLEFVRGADSTIYGSDAMSSVVQLFTSAGHTRSPQFDFGADGGTFSTTHGYAALSGAVNRFDYNIFGDQFNTTGQGINDDYSNSSQGANLGAKLSDKVAVRLRLRHSNSRSGVQGAWNFEGHPAIPPDSDQFARQNNFLGSFEVAINASPQWQHTFTGFEYHHVRLNMDPVASSTCFVLFVDCDFTDIFNANRAGLDYRGRYSPRSWAQTNFGYHFEDENGFANQNFSGFILNSHGLRRNHELYGEEVIIWKRFTAIGGVRYIHNENFGDKGVPRLALTYLALRGNNIFTGTRLRFAVREGITEPRLDDSSGSFANFSCPVTLPNPTNLKPEQNRSIETGFIQNFGQKASIAATYFNNQFTNQIVFSFVPQSQFLNLNKSMAHGAEVEFHARPVTRVSIDAAYNYTATQILDAPQNIGDPLLGPGKPLLRRPRHSGNLLLNYIGNRWGANLGGSFVGRRPDSDFGIAPLPIDHAAGYARLDSSAWYAVNHWVTGYVNIENLLNHRYEEVVGYPALKANFRAGLRFRVGGEK
jgi:outer membrane cobalamin receptor